MNVLPGAIKARVPMMSEDQGDGNLRVREAKRSRSLDQEQEQEQKVESCSCTVAGERRWEEQGRCC